MLKGKQILFVRMAITTTLSTAYMWWTDIPYFPFGMKEVRWLLLLRGIGGFFGVFGMYCMSKFSLYTPHIVCLHAPHTYSHALPHLQQQIEHN